MTFTVLYLWTNYIRTISAKEPKVTTSTVDKDDVVPGGGGIGGGGIGGGGIGGNTEPPTTLDVSKFV